MKYLWSFIFLIFLAVETKAQALFTQGLNTRSRAMGGAQIAFARGTDALFYNPAALALVNNYGFTLANLNVGASKNSKRLVEQMANSGGNISATDLDDLYGKTFFAEISAHSGMVFPFFGFGAYSSNYVLEEFSNPVYSTVHLDFISDYGYVVAGALPLGQQLSLGIAGRHIKRWGGKQDISASDFIGSNEMDVIESHFTDKGAGNALDLSMLYLIPKSDVAIAAVWKNVGGTSFKTTSGSNGVAYQEDSLSLGIAHQADTDWGMLTTGLDYNFVNQSGELPKKLHLGTELSVGLLDLRAGLSQGYLTYGAGLDLFFLQLDFASYADEIGASAGDNKNDRYQVSLTFKFEMDQAFKLKQPDGKKRRLMQRR